TLGQVASEYGARVLICTDERIASIPLINEVVSDLEAHGLDVRVFSGTQAELNRTGNRGGCLVKVKQVPQRVLQVVDSTFLRLLPAGCLRSIPADVDG